MTFVYKFSCAESFEPILHSSVKHQSSVPALSPAHTLSTQAGSSCDNNRQWLNNKILCYAVNGLLIRYLFRSSCRQWKRKRQKAQPMTWTERLRNWKILLNQVGVCYPLLDLIYWLQVKFDVMWNSYMYCLMCQSMNGCFWGYGLKRLLWQTDIGSKIYNALLGTCHYFMVACLVLGFMLQMNRVKEGSLLQNCRQFVILVDSCEIKYVKDITLHF